MQSLNVFNFNKTNIEIILICIYALTLLSIFVFDQKRKISKDILFHYILLIMKSAAEYEHLF